MLKLYSFNFNSVKNELSSESTYPQGCEKHVKLEQSVRRNLEIALDRERKKRKDERKRRRHLERLLGASMQKHKATELRAQVAEEALKIYCPTNVSNV